MIVVPMTGEHRESARILLEKLFGEAVERPEEEGEILLALAPDGKVAGLIALDIRPWADGCTTAPVAYVEAWITAAGYRRRGVGRALMKAAEDWARAKGMTELGSDAAMDNRVSRKAHVALGFAATARVQLFSKRLIP